MVKNIRGGSDDAVLCRKFNYNPSTGKSEPYGEENIIISEEELRNKANFVATPIDTPKYTVAKCIRTRDEKYVGSYPTLGGGRRGTAVAKWTATTRHTKLPDGSKRVLYKNPKYPGEARIRKMHKGRDGKMKAAYVTPPRA